MVLSTKINTTSVQTFAAICCNYGEGGHQHVGVATVDIPSNLGTWNFLCYSDFRARPRLALVYWASANSYRLASPSVGQGGLHRLQSEPTSETDLAQEEKGRETQALADIGRTWCKRWVYRRPTLPLVGSLQSPYVCGLQPQNWAILSSMTIIVCICMRIHMCVGIYMCTFFLQWVLHALYRCCGH